MDKRSAANIMAANEIPAKRFKLDSNGIIASKSTEMVSDKTDSLEKKIDNEESDDEGVFYYKVLRSETVNG